MFKKLVLIFILFLLTACSFRPLPASDIQYYQLTAKATKPVAPNKTTPYTLLVLTPVADPGYQTNNMVYVVKPYQLQQYVKHRWVSSPAQMLAPLIAGSIRESHFFHAVVTAPFIGQSDYRLETRLIRLQHEFSGDNSEIKLVMQVTLIKNITGSVIAEEQFIITSPVLEKTPYGSVVTANQAVQQLLDDIVKFCIKNIH